MERADELDGGAVDGRTARRDRNRDAVLDAALELFSEGDLNPSAVDVAERSDVSLRSVYRYYDDIDELVRAAIERTMVRNEHRFSIPADAAAGDRSERIERFVEHRCSTYESIAGLAGAAAARARTDPRVRAGFEHRMAQLRAHQEAAFAVELDLQRGRTERDDLLDAITLLTGLEAMSHLYGSAHRTPVAIRRILRRGLGRLLADPAS